MNLQQFNSYLISRPHLKITLYFLIFGFMWILLSDRALSILYSDIEEAYHLQTYKGWFFIVMTTILIFVTSRNNFKKIIKLSSNLSQSESILRESVRLNETLLNNIPNTDVFLFDNEMKILKTGGKEITKMKFSAQNSSDRKISDVLPLEIYNLLKPLFQKSLEGYDLTLEHNYKGIDYVYFTAPVRSPDKIVAGVLVSQNVTELKKIQRELNNRNVFIETILNNLPVGLAVNDDRSGKLEYMNDKFEEIYGWPLKNENLEGFFNTVYQDPDYRENIKNRIMKDIYSGLPERMVWENIHITTRKGNHRIISARNIPVKEQNLMVSIVTDVTETRKAERQIIESRNRYKAIFEHSPYPIWEKDFSQLNTYLESLKRKGVTDIENYLNLNPEEVKYMAGLIHIIDVNKATVGLFKAVDKKQLFDRSFYTEPEESLDAIKQEISGFFHRRSQMEFTQTNKDFQGNLLILRIRIVEIPSLEDDFKHILVSASDITNLVQTRN